MEFNRFGKVVIVTSLFRLLYGGYLIGNDLYRFNDANSALQVLLIYGLIGFFTSLFVSGKRYGLFCLIGLDILFIIAQSVFSILTLSKIIDPGLHDPLTNWWSMVLMIFFSLMSLIFSLKTSKESRAMQARSVNTP